MRTLITWKSLAVAAGMALTLVPGLANAAPVTFNVNEGAVPGATPQVISVNGLTGKYNELLTGNFLVGGPNFTASLIVNFSSYTKNGPLVTSQIGALDPVDEAANPNLYSLYAIVTVSGTVTSNDDGTVTTLTFKPTNSTADIWVDPSRNNTQNYAVPSVVDTTSDDLHIMTASTPLAYPQSNGSVMIDDATGTVVGGSYALVYTNVSLVNPDGPLYWPGLTSLTLRATASGDVDPASETGGVFPTNVIGDTSIAFNEVAAVPEPASLALLGVGLLGVCVGARRRRNVR